MELVKKIKDRAPEYDSKFEELIGRFTVLQGGRAGYAGEGVSFDQSKQFTTKYEMFMYAFFLGVRNESRIPFPQQSKKTKFIEIKNWQPADLADYVVLGALALSNIEFIELEKMEAPEIEKEISNIRLIIEEYANGGFEILNYKFDNDPDFFANNDNCFIDLLGSH